MHLRKDNVADRTVFPSKYSQNWFLIFKTFKFLLLIFEFIIIKFQKGEITYITKQLYIF